MGASMPPASDTGAIAAQDASPQAADAPDGERVRDGRRPRRRARARLATPPSRPPRAASDAPNNARLLTSDPVTAKPDEPVPAPGPNGIGSPGPPPCPGGRSPTSRTI